MFLIALLLLVAVPKLNATLVNCEKIEGSPGVAGKRCYMNSTSTISVADVTLSDSINFEVDGLMLDFNKKIEFLPIDVYKVFPGLSVLAAENCSLREISARNFEKLSSLTFLDLRGNQLKTIPNYCFSGLVKLSHLLLDNNQIVSMNGAAFANLPSLTQVWLKGNVCIDKIYSSEYVPDKFRRKVTRNCASGDSSQKQVSCSDIYRCSSEVLSDFDNKTASCCYMYHATLIDTTSDSFVTDEAYRSLSILVMHRHKHVEFLPIMVYETFPHLIGYSVKDTPLRSISKKNFEKLFELEVLWLESGQLETIRSDTFEDLASLRMLMILRQKLKALNGKAFENLHNLKLIGLRWNDCSDLGFNITQTGVTLARASEIVTRKCGFDELETKEVACEKYQDFKLYECCWMNTKTTIDSDNFVVADLKDEDVGAIILNENKKIEYLPLRLHMQFPNLYVYLANGCAIKQITKENFEKLNRLTLLVLSFNNIQKIRADTFNGVPNLSSILLSNNQIKSINGRTFDHLPLLHVIDLGSNVCIDDHRKDNQTIKEFTRQIIQKCAFTETGEREFEKVFDIECGVGLGGSGFVVGGKETKRGQWPFMAALLLESTNQFFCGGSIITNSHVLSAAHCIQEKNFDEPLGTNDIVVVLGRHNISRPVELGSEIRGIKEINVHPRWNPRDPKYEADLAVLKMDREVQFSELIQPVCLTVEPEISEREAGYVVGWGKSEGLARHETVPRQVLISSVTTDVCFAKDYKLGYIFAQGMYCAGGDGAGPCSGDSGGGFFVRYHGLWTLRGIVSSGSSKADGGCDVERYSLYTSVYDFASWIKDSVKLNRTSLLVSPQATQKPTTLPATTSTSRVIQTSTASTTTRRYFKISEYF